MIFFFERCFFACRKVNSLAIGGDVDRYTCRTPHFHMYSHSTDHTAQRTCVHGSSSSCVPKIGQSSTVSCFILRLTAQRTPAQVLSHLPLLCYCRPLLRIQTCCPRIHLSAVKIHGRMVFLRNSTPPQVKSPKESSSTLFWSTH